MQKCGEQRHHSCLDFVFMQDGARAHTARSTIEYLDGNCPEYVPPVMWPPNWCDLNPLDLAIWGDLERRMWDRHRHGFTDLAAFKQAIVDEWEAYPQETIAKAINTFRTRLGMVINAQGGHIRRYL